MVHISRKFQNEQPLAWDSFKRLIGLAMVGERECIKKALNNILTVHSFFAYFFHWSGFRTVRILQARISLFLYILKCYNLGVVLVSQSIGCSKFVFFFNSKKKQKKEIKNKNKKHKKRGKKEKRKKKES